MKDKLDLDKLEKADFEIDKKAFTPEVLTCCNGKMKRAEIEVKLQNSVFIKIKGFECSKCRKRSLGLEEATKLDRALIVSRMMNRDFKMRRSLSFDGDNYTFRIPKEFTHDLHKKKIEIVPLGAREFCAMVK